MRRFLYISPFFPPLSRVGAFRPLKFTRHITEFNWQPVVLCDLWPSAKTDDRLLEFVPDSTIIIREYSKRTAIINQQHATPSLTPIVSTMPANTRNNEPDKHIGFFSGREWLPMGDAVFNIPYALKTARTAIKKHHCCAIMVNADPVAALLVGSMLSKETGLPYVADLRDPWGPCELRRPLRPFYTRWIEGRVEAMVIDQASRIILNTDTTLNHYRLKYSNVSPAKFTVIRNHGDKTLIYAGNQKAPTFKPFTLLFLGSFSRFVRADPLLHLLVELKNNHITANQFQLVLTSKLSLSAETLAKTLGVFDYILNIPSTSYTNVGHLMDNSDMLTLILPTKQRIQAKFYDYLFSNRPILAIAESHAELKNILAETGAGEIFHPTEKMKMCKYIIDFLLVGKQPIVKRHPGNIENYSSRTASKKLAAVLEAVVL